MNYGLAWLLLMNAWVAAAELPQAGDNPESTAECWLRNEVAEVQVGAHPYPRVIAFRLHGGLSPLRVSQTDQYYGVRSWYMEPGQVATSGLPALQPAELRLLSERHVRITAAPEPQSGLQLIMEVKLDEDAPVLTVRHGFRNMRDCERRLAAWVIMAVPHEGMGLVLWALDKTRVKSLLMFPGAAPDEPCLRLGRRAMGVDFGVPSRAGQFKVGTNSDAGWVAYLRPGLGLISTVRHENNAEYPEAGATTTFYTCGSQVAQGFGEVEQVGPLTLVAPGRTLWLEQRLEIVRLPAVAAEDADTWLEVVQEAMILGGNRGNYPLPP